MSEITYEINALHFPGNYFIYVFKFFLYPDNN